MMFLKLIFAWSFSTPLLLLTPNSGSSFKVDSTKNEAGFLAIERKARNWKKSRFPKSGKLCRSFKQITISIKAHHAAWFLQVVDVFPCFVEVVAPDVDFVSMIRLASRLETSEAAEHDAVDVRAWISHLSKINYQFNFFIWFYLFKFFIISACLCASAFFRLLFCPFWRMVMKYHCKVTVKLLFNILIQHKRGPFIFKTISLLFV